MRARNYIFNPTLDQGSDGTTTTGRKIKRRLEELERKASAMLPAAPRRTDFVVDNRNGDGNGNEKNGSGRQGLSRQEQSLQRRGMMNQNMVSFSLMDLNYGGRRYHHKLETTPSTSASIIGQTANKQPFRDYSNSHSSAQVSSSSAIAKVMTVQQPGGQHGFPLPENSR